MTDWADTSEHEDEELLAELENKVADLLLIDAANNYRMSLEEKCDSITAWYDANGSLTPAQRTAIENMIAGANKWLDRE